MTTKMLIDARHPEETRVVLQRGKRVDDFEFESATKRQLKGNIYLAKVTRVEPSLQAAFVDYGGNRHGFLAFSEIHPDYYQIPTEDREALMEAYREELADEEDDDDSAEDAEAAAADEEASAHAAEDDADTADEDADAEASAETDEDGESDAEAAPEPEPAAEAAEVEEAQEKIRTRRRGMRKRYKIQEVIKKRQILLIQIVKEERGNKGAALTTYLSLAGRYCVLMPNSTHGGGISRKISNAADRKRLRSVMDEMNLPSTMGCIIRTAGMKRTKTEIKRDFDYLIRLWEGIRESTLKSTAPTTIHEEGNLIKRAIRDLYTRDIDEVLVDGEEGYKTAKNFMKMLMPSHARRVIHYKDVAPLYQSCDVDVQLETIFSPTVQLKSGGYIVINPTEALVSIDVNSGKSTKEHNIEETAVRTNLEAASEVARQLRLRDMAGLIVIDFIDMDDRGNNRSVERRMKDALKDDRARIQVGRISQFGLMEMSRQRLRQGMLEATTMECGTCQGTGIVRNVQSSSLQALRAIEAQAENARGGKLRITLHPDVGLYLLNEKRVLLMELETHCDFHIEVQGDRTLAADEFKLERIEVNEDGDEKIFKAEPRRVEASSFADDNDDGRKRKRKRRSRGGRGRSDEDGQDENDTSSQDGDNEAPQRASSHDDDGEEKPARRRKRRGRRGGRRNRENDVAANAETQAPAREGAENTDEAPAPQSADAPSEEAPAPVEETAEAQQAGEESKPPKRRRARRKPAAKAEAGDASADAPAEKAEGADTAEPEEKPKRRRRTAKPKAKAEAPKEEAAQPDAKAEPAPKAKPVAEAEKQNAEPSAPLPEPVSPEEVKAKRPARKSFWQRAFDRK